jgi:hypothetical protein
VRFYLACSAAGAEGGISHSWRYRKIIEGKYSAYNKGLNIEKGPAADNLTDPKFEKLISNTFNNMKKR